MKRIAAFISILSLLALLSFPAASFAKAKPKVKKKTPSSAKVIKAPPFGIDHVKQLTAIVHSVDAVSGVVVIREGKGKNKKVLTSGATIVRVTPAGSSVIALGELALKEKAHFWVKKEIGPKKEYQALLITQFVSGSSGAGAPTGTSTGDVVLQFSAPSSQGLENVTSPTSIAVSLSKASASPVKVSYAVSGGTASGSGTDYTLTAGELTIAAGQTSGIIPFAVVNDTAPESDETVVVTLSSPTGATLGAAVAHTYTIQDDDQPRVSFTAASSSAAENVSSVTMSLALTGTTTQEVRVDYGISGTAVNGADFNLAAATAVIPAGQTSATISAAILEDTAFEESETLIVTLSNARGAALGSPSVYTYTITDNDVLKVGFSTGSSSSSESVASANIPVSLTGTTTKEVRVAYAVTGGTATGGGTDYTLTAGTLSIPAGSASANIPVTVVNDGTNEVNETIEITLSGPVDATLNTTTVHTFTIQDDDVRTVQFSTSAGSGAENVTPVSVLVTLSGAAAGDVQVTYTVGGTATGSGTDYTLASSTLAIPAGQTSATISLAIVDDALADPNETVTITLSSPTNATLGSNTVYTYTINDND